MSDDQRVADDLAELGAMCLTPLQHHQAAQHRRSMPQMKAAITELQVPASTCPTIPTTPPPMKSVNWRVTTR